MYFSSNCFLESVGNCQLRSLQEVDFSDPSKASLIKGRFGGIVYIVAENESLTCVRPSFWDRKSCDFLGLLLSSEVTVLTVFKVLNIPPNVLLKFLCCNYLYEGNKIILTYKSNNPLT